MTVMRCCESRVSHRIGAYKITFLRRWLPEPYDIGERAGKKMSVMESACEKQRQRDCDDY